MTEEATNPTPEETTDAAPETASEATPETTADAADAAEASPEADKAPASEPVAEPAAPVAEPAAPVAEPAAPVAEPVAAPAEPVEPVAAPAAKTAAPSDEPNAPAPEDSLVEKVSLPADAHGWWRGTGRRKAAVARVRIKPGEGSFIVNQRPMESFFNEERDQKNLMAVLEKTSMVGSVDIHTKVNGGGYTGQAGAIILGLARALRNYDISLESTLRENGFLSRDPRKVERKKPGQPGARKKFQFSKR